MSPVATDPVITNRWRKRLMIRRNLLEDENVHAVVVTKGGAGVATLQAWCAERLSDYKVPETIDLTTDPLPRNANGKVLKRQLREARNSSG